MKRAATQNQAFSKLSNFYFDLRRPPPSRQLSKTEEQKADPRGKLEFANSRWSPGGQAWN